jgi:excisionase family DNA binding protein
MNEQIKLERLLKIDEVSERTSLSRSAIYRLINEEKLQSVKINKSLRFKESELNRFINSLEAM